MLFINSECVFISHLWLTVQQHGSVPSESQESLWSFQSLTGARRCSTSFVDTLQRRAQLHAHSELQTHLPCSCPKQKPAQWDTVKQTPSPSLFLSSLSLRDILTIGNDSSVEAILSPCESEFRNDFDHKPQEQAKHSTLRTCPGPSCSPNICQACVALLLKSRTGSRGSLDHSSHSPVLLNQALVSGLIHPVPGTCNCPDHRTPATPNSMLASSLEKFPSSAFDLCVPSPNPLNGLSPVHQAVPSAVHITPPSPEHVSHSCSEGALVHPLPTSSPCLKIKAVSSPVHIVIPSPVMSPGSPEHLSSCSPVDPCFPLSPSSSRVPLSTSRSFGDNIDLSHLNQCLQNIISPRTNSPVLMDRTAWKPGSDTTEYSIFCPQDNNQSTGSLPTTPHKALSMHGMKVEQVLKVCKKKMNLLTH